MLIRSTYLAAAVALANASCSAPTAAGSGTQQPISALSTNNSNGTPATSAGRNSDGAANSGSCLGLVNGTATTAFPAVVRLMAVHGTTADICSGTFISPTAVITAAHCIDSTFNGGLYIVGGPTVSFSGNPIQNGIAATKALTLGAIGDALNPQDPTAVAKDTAIVLFPPGNATAIATIGPAKPATGSTVTSVGYGLTTLLDAPQDPNYNASKHEGTTDVVDSDDSDSVNIYVGDYTAAQSAAGNGADALNSFGDSGGPMLYNNNIVATLSNGGDGLDAQGTETYFSVFVDINSATTQQLIAMANADGAEIPPPGTASTVPTVSTAPASGTAAASTATVASTASSSATCSN